MPSPDQQRVADFVRNRRGELGLTQEQLAEKAGVVVGTISTLERAERWPWAKNRTGIEHALGWETGSLQEISRGGTPVSSDPGSERHRYLDPGEQHIADTPGLSQAEIEALIAVKRGMRDANQRRTGT